MFFPSLKPMMVGKMAFLAEYYSHFPKLELNPGQTKR